MLRKLASLSRPFRGHGGRMLRFAVVGVANTAIDVALFGFLYYAQGWPLLWSNSAGYAAGLANSYLCNHLWTFRAAPARLSVRRAALFVLVNLLRLLLANVAIALLAHLMAPWAAKLGAVGITFGWNYWASQRYVFLAGPEVPPAADGRRGRSAR